MRQRILISVLIACGSGLYCYIVATRFQQGAGDFTWSYQAARSLIRGGNPYAHTSPGTIPYPLPAALLAIPFCALSATVAGAAFLGLSSGLLAYGVTRQGYWRLLIFLSYPYWTALIMIQWTPLITAAAFLPWLLPAAVAKPHIGLPVLATRGTRAGWIAGAALVALSLLAMPSWPRAWVAQLTGYQHFFPILVFPGQFLALALLRPRDPDARFLLLSSLLPQRWFYDALTLWAIPRSRREMLAITALSWVIGIWRWFRIPEDFHQVGRWSVLFIFLPLLALLLLRLRKPHHSLAASSLGP